MFLHWKGLVNQHLGSEYMATWDRVLEILQDSTRDKTTMYLIRYAFQVTVHSLWRERNGLRHGEAPTNAMQLEKPIEKQIHNKISTLTWEHYTKLEGAMAIWLSSRASSS